MAGRGFDPFQKHLVVAQANQVTARHPLLLIGAYEWALGAAGGPWLARLGFSQPT
jgi:hypothetical protein